MDKVSPAAPPKFRVGEKIKIDNATYGYEVLKTPETCIHNDKRWYQLKSLRPIETPPFFREQDDVEKNFVSWDGNAFLYPIETPVRHKKTGGLYEIMVAPDKGRLEATGEPAYFYRSLKDGLIWARAQTTMEDGRFEPILLGDRSAV